MALRHWHKSKIILLWVAFLFIIIVTWAANARIYDDYVHLLDPILAFFWGILFIPLFILTWRWATTLQSNSPPHTQELDKPSGPQNPSFKRTKWENILGPQGLIAVGTLLGLAGWGIRGGIAGFVIAWCVSMIIGLVIQRVLYGTGTVPKSVRRDTAQTFLRLHRDTVQAVYPGLDDNALQAAIEEEIEHICRIASAGAEGSDVQYDRVMAAAQLLEGQETRPLPRHLITALGMHLERTWWPNGSVRYRQ